jgi:hypothetical protein
LKILGIRTAPAQLRYAIIEIDNGTATLINGADEHLIKVPAGMNANADILAWQKDEVDRILRQNPDINKVILKTGEYGRSDTKSSRLGAHLDAIAILAAKQANIPVEEKTYSQIGTQRAKVKEHAENRVGRTSTHWNEQIADAIVAAWSCRGDS